MPLSKYKAWRHRGAELLDAGLPAGQACETADGRQFSQEEIVGFLTSGETWSAFRRSLPHLQWYRGPSWLPGFVLRVIKVDFRRYDFAGYDTGCTFQKCNFGRSSFEAANFGRIGPHGTIEARPRFLDCNFRSAKFVGGYLNGCAFSGSDFSHAELNGIHVFSGDFNRVKFYKTLIAADFEATRFESADFVELSL